MTDTDTRRLDPKQSAVRSRRPAAKVGTRIAAIAIATTVSMSIVSSAAFGAAAPSQATCLKERRELYAGELVYRDMFPERYVSELELKQTGYIRRMSRHYDVELVEGGNQFRIVLAGDTACRSTPGVSSS